VEKYLCNLMFDGGIDGLSLSILPPYFPVK
jgi:hypothetical protein